MPRLIRSQERRDALKHQRSGVQLTMQGRELILCIRTGRCDRGRHEAGWGAVDLLERLTRQLVRTDDRPGQLTQSVDRDALGGRSKALLGPLGDLSVASASSAAASAVMSPASAMASTASAVLPSIGIHPAIVRPTDRGPSPAERKEVTALLKSSRAATAFPTKSAVLPRASASRPCSRSCRTLRAESPAITSTSRRTPATPMTLQNLQSADDDGDEEARHRRWVLVCFCAMSACEKN